MQPILTQCPRCQTSFKVSDKQLAIAEGFVRCGSCLDVFSAVANRITIKQPAGSDPSADFPEATFEGDEESAEQMPEDKPAVVPALTEAAINTPASAADPAAVALSHSTPLKYPVSQLVDGDDVFPVNVVAGARPSPFPNPGFAFDDDIPLGDMVLDDDDLAEEDEPGDEQDNEPEVAEEFEDKSYSASATVYEEYTDIVEDDAEYIDEIVTEPTRAVPILRQTKPDTSASYEDALIADDDLGSSFDEEFHDGEETILLELDAEFTVAAEPGPAFEEDTNSADKTAPEIVDTIVALTAEEVDPQPAAAARSVENTQVEQEATPSSALQEVKPADAVPVTPPAGTDGVTEATLDSAQALDVADLGMVPKAEAEAEAEREAAAAKEPVITDPEAEALFHSIYDTPSVKDEVGISRDIADQDQDIQGNQEALYETCAASIPAEAGAEEVQELMAQGFGATRDNDDNLDAEDSFTAANFSHTDEFETDGFSALAIDTADKTEELTDLPLKTSSRHEKEELRQYLAGLEDADALEPLPATTMDTIEAEPLTLEVGHSFRKYVSTFGWFCLSLGLATVFAFQLVAANIELMQESSTYSRYLPLFCRVLDCPEPGASTAAIESLSSQDLLVRSHPRIADALEVSFIFRNDADLPQPFPLVELSFRDNSRRLIANRLFAPEEYLPPELAVLDMMPARSSVQVMLELVDPGSEAVDYEIIFRDAAEEALNSSTGPAGTP